MQNRFFVVALFAAGFVTAVAATAAAQNGPARPKITGISHLAVYTSDAAATEHFYTASVGAVKDDRSRESAGRALYAEPDAVC